MNRRHCVNQGPGAFFTNWAFAPGWEAPALRLPVDGLDVTDACGERVAGTWPPSRVELVHSPPEGWLPGVNEAAVVAPGGAPDTWSFSVR